MKRLIVNLLFIIGCLSSQFARAQSESGLASIRYNSDQEYSGNLRLNEINAKAYKYVLKNYPGVKEISWIKTTTGFTAMFREIETVTKLYFNESGYFDYSEKGYGENGLPEDIKTLINIRFPQFKIGVTTELYNGTQYAYEVHISDLKITRVIDIKNNEIEMVNEYSN